MNKPLIMFQSFNKEIPSALSIVNWGEWVGDKIRFETSQGEQLKRKSEIENSNVKVISFEDIDIKGSLRYWFKSNPGAYNKPIEIDYSIQTGEVYKGNCWHLSLMISHNDKTIKVKPLY